MPVGLIGGGECPGKCVGGEALEDVYILGDVAIVVIVDEGMAIDRVVEDQRDYRQQQADYGITLFWCGERSGAFRR